MKKLISFAALLFIAMGCMFANKNIAMKAWKSKNYEVSVEAYENMDTPEGTSNAIIVGVVDKKTQNIYYMFYIVDGDRDYLLQEYTNGFEPNHYGDMEPQDIDVDMFAGKYLAEHHDWREQRPSYYREIKKEGYMIYIAYGLTETDQKLRWQNDPRSLR